MMQATPRTSVPALRDPHGDASPLSSPRPVDENERICGHYPGRIIIYELDGLRVQRDDAVRVLVIQNRWLQFSPLEYHVLLPLLEYFRQYVSSATLLQEAYGCSTYQPREANRLAKVLQRIRTKLAPYDLMIDTVISTSSRPWGYLLQRATTRDSIQAFPRQHYPC